MYLVDYHMHSKYSFDGKEEISTLCEAAIEKGLKEIAITDHYDLFEDKKYARPVQFAQLYADIKEAVEIYSDRLKVKVGIELGQQYVDMKEAEVFLKQYPLDFIIGSVHNLEDAFDVGEYNFEQINMEELYHDYLQALIRIVQTCDFDVLGHITYPMRYAYAQTGQYPKLTPYKEQIEYLYKELIKRDKGIEVNASGFFQPMKRSMPDLELLRFYKECGGRILTIGCDSHRREHVGSTVRQGIEVIQQAGFSTITVYTNRQPEFIKL